MQALTLIPLLVALAWLLGVASMLGVLVLLVVLTIVAAAFNASPRPPGLRISSLARLAGWGEEILAGLLIMLVTLPLERLLMRRDVPARRSHAWPVLLLHGYINNAGALWTLRDELLAQGYGVHTLNLAPVHIDLDRHAPRIEARVREILARTGAARVVLVCHSMGGLAARAYLRAYPQAPVAQLITLGTPHQGTICAHVAWGTAGRQMLPGSPWLAALAADEAVRAGAAGAAGAWPCPVVSVFSYDDNIVVPQAGAILPGARNLPLAGIGHMSLPMSRPVARLVIDVMAVPPASA